MQQKKIIILGGPTAVGKTAVAIKWARELNTEIISADSRQCYRELKIGVARPSEEELNQVPHHFIASHSIADKITAADFEEYSLQKTMDIFRKKDVVMMTGGTGLYIKAFAEGLDEIPEVPPSIREEIVQSYQKNGMEWLQNEVERMDPAFFAKGEIKNPHRLMRALEVVRHTGKSINHFKKGLKKHRDFEIIKIALSLPRPILIENINNRVDKMMEMGLVEEVRGLLGYRSHNALNTVGYKEIFDFLDGNIPLEKAVEAIKTNTRQYAKRQITWFKKDTDFQWMDSRHASLPLI